MDIQTIVKEKQVNLIDVRERLEFMMKKINGSSNMPLSKFEKYVDEIKAMEGKKVFYCRSGNRSGQAVEFCKSIGIEDVYNGGSLSLVNSYLLPN